ncbi:MAG: gas vesicle protein GvpG [Gaiellaceae bacterium]
MGLITGLLTLPLAPVRGTVWLAERIQEQAELDANDDAGLRAQLLDLEAARQSGDYDEAELDAAEDELLARLIEIRGYGQEVTPDGIE